MKRIKIFLGDSREELQKVIDVWIVEVNPDILSISMSTDDDYNRYLAVLYDDNIDITPVKL